MSASNRGFSCSGRCWNTMASRRSGDGLQPRHADCQREVDSSTACALRTALPAGGTVRASPIAAVRRPSGSCGAALQLDPAPRRALHNTNAGLSTPQTAPVVRSPDEATACRPTSPARLPVHPAPAAPPATAPQSRTADAPNAGMSGPFHRLTSAFASFQAGSESAFCPPTAKPIRRSWRNRPASSAGHTPPSSFLHRRFCCQRQDEAQQVHGSFLWLWLRKRLQQR